MKKHLHGKRHSIARRSVAVGRNNRRARKLERSIALIKQIDPDAAMENMARMINLAAQKTAVLFAIGSCVLR